MPFFDDLSKKVSTTTQNVVRMSKNFADTTRLNSMISDEQRKITGMYAQIGQLYYETMEHNNETKMGAICLSITSAFERIEGYSKEIRQIKGEKPCIVCGTDVPLSSSFCSICGAKIGVVHESGNESQSDIAGKHCSECGGEAEEGMAFCTSCGHRLETGNSRENKDSNGESESDKENDSSGENKEAM